jgi:hypothetical protein
VISSWFALDNAIKAARGTAGDASGGPNVDPVTGVPANQPPPSQDGLRGGWQGGGTARPAPVVVPIVADDQVSATVTLIEEDLTALTRADWTADLFADARDLFRSAGDAERDLRRVADGRYVADLLANPSDAYGDISGVERALGNLDGNSATVIAYANTVNARNALNALTGYQGDAYVYAYTIPVGGGPTGIVRRHGGLIGEEPLPARNGRMIRWNEGGAGEMAWRPDGSLVVSAPATRAALGRGGLGGGGDIHVHGPVTIVARTDRVYDALAARALGAARSS